MPPTNNGIPNGSATSREECRCPNCLSHQGLEPDPERAELYTDKATEIAQASRCANPSCPTDAVDPKAIRKQLDTDALKESEPVIDRDSISLSEIRSKAGNFAISQSIKVIGIVILFVISAMFGTYGGGFGGGDGNPGIAQAGGAYENATEVSGSDPAVVYTEGNWSVYKSGDTYIVSGAYDGSVVYLTDNGYVSDSVFKFDSLEAAKEAITIWQTKHAERPQDFPGVDNVSASVEDSNWKIFKYNGSHVIGGEIDGEVVFLHPNSGYSDEPYFYNEKSDAEKAVLYWASLSQVSDLPTVNPITDEELRAALTNWSEDASKFETWNSTEYGDWTIYTNGTHYTAAIYIDGNIRYIDFNGTTSGDPVYFNSQTELLASISKWQDASRTNTFDGNEIGDWRIYTDGNNYVAAAYLDGELVYLQADGTYATTLYEFSDKSSLLDATGTWLDGDHADIEPIDSTIPEAGDWSVYTNGSVYTAAGYLNDSIQYLDENNAASSDPVFFDNGVDFREAIDAWNPDDHPELYPITTDPWTIYTDGSSFAAAAMKDGEVVYIQPDGSADSTPYTYEDVASLLEAIDQWRDGDTSGFEPIDSSSPPADLGAGWWDPNWGYGDIPSTFEGDWESTSLDSTYIPSDLGDGWYAPDQGTSYPDTSSIDSTDNTSLNSDWEQIDSQTGSSGGEITYPDDGMVSDPSGNTDDGMTGATITGSVTDSNGDPVEGATVTLHSNPRTTTTDADGTYTFQDVSAGEHTLHVAPPDGTDLAGPRNVSVDVTQEGKIEPLNDPSNALFFENDQGYLAQDQITFITPEKQPIQLQGQGVNITNTISVENPSNIDEVDVTLVPKTEGTDKTYSMEGTDTTGTLSISGDTESPEQELVLSGKETGATLSKSGTTSTGSETFSVEGNRQTENISATIDPVVYSKKDTVTGDWQPGSGTFTISPDTVLEPTGGTVTAEGWYSENSKSSSGTFTESGEMTLNNDGNLNGEAEFTITPKETTQDVNNVGSYNGNINIHNPGNQEVEAQITITGKEGWVTIQSCDSWAHVYYHSDDLSESESTSCTFNGESGTYKEITGVEIGHSGLGDYSYGRANSPNAYHYESYDGYDGGAESYSTKIAHISHGASFGFYSYTRYHSHNTYGWSWAKAESTVQEKQSTGEVTLNHNGKTVTTNHLNAGETDTVTITLDPGDNTISTSSKYNDMAVDASFTAKYKPENIQITSNGNTVYSNSGVVETTQTVSTSGIQPGTWSVGTSMDAGKAEIEATLTERNGVKDPTIYMNGEQVFSHSGVMKNNEQASLPDSVVKSDNDIEIQTSAGHLPYNFTIDTKHVPTDPEVSIDGTTALDYSGPMVNPQTVRIPESDVSPGENTVDFATTEGKVNWTIQYDAKAVPETATVSIDGTTYEWPTDFEGDSKLPTEPNEDTSINISSLDLGDQTVAVQTSAVDSIETAAQLQLRYEGETEQTAQPAIKVTNSNGEVHTKQLSDDVLVDGKLTSEATTTLPGEWFTEGNNQVTIVTEDGTKIGATVTTEGLTYQNKTMTSVVG